MLKSITFEGKDNKRKATPVITNIAISNQQAAAILEKLEKTNAGFSLF